MILPQPVREFWRQSFVARLGLIATLVLLFAGC